MSPPKKSIAQYEKEAREKGGCLIHPSHGVARRIYKLRHGQLSANIFVCHICDTPLCIKDAHHFLGTSRVNIHDSVVKGRHSSFRKGGVRFSGPHTSGSKLRIGEGLRLAYKEGRR